jgi:hypothetical protein
MEGSMGFATKKYPCRKLNLHLQVLIAIAFSIAIPLSQPVYADPWVGLFFSPQANTSNSHAVFLYDFEAMVKTLKEKGLNTIVFDMNYGAYHFTSDARMNKASYSASRGFTPAEAHRMAEIVRENGMQVMVALQVLTHSVGNVYPYVYPEYMLPGKVWQQGISYKANKDYIQYNGRTYKSIVSHMSNMSNAPPATGYWLASPSDTRDPFNKEGESAVFKMIDELIATFTVNGVKPEGFHIGSDELGWWYDDPEQATGKSSAQIYAMAVSNAYNHIKANNPNMEVIMWGDMLDPFWNGAPKSVQYNLSGRNTAAATDLLPKGLIIADWRYAASQSYRHDDVREIFPSVGEFINKGFRVWPTSWNEAKGTTDLVWTGNMEQARSSKVMGHLYSTWLSGIVPELKSLLTDPNYQTSDYVLSGVSESNKPIYRQYYRGIAESINATANIVGLKQCRGTDYYCGAYPNCEDSTQKSTYYGSIFRGYYCSNNLSVFSVINFPDDYVGYWKFDGDAADVSGRNNGTLVNGATIINHAVKGQVVSFASTNDYVRVKDNVRLDMGTGSMSISAWFKAGASSELGTIVSKTPDLNNYTLFLHQDGRIRLVTNGNNFYRYSTNGISYRDNKWHHVVAIFDSSVPTINIYVDGVITNGTKMFLKGNNVKSSTSDLFIGNNNGSGQYPFRGSIDDLMIFNSVLTPAEVKMVYATQKKAPLAPTIRITK